MKEGERFLEIFENSLKKNWDLPVFSDYRLNTYLYKDLAEKIAELHFIFDECGLKKGDKIAILGANSSNWGIAFWSVLTYGAVLVPIFREFKPDNAHHILHHSDAKFLFTDEDVWHTLSCKKIPHIEAVFLLNRFALVKHANTESNESLDKINNLYKTKRSKSFEKEDIHYHRDQDNELAIIAYTTVTTGSSLGVMIPYRALLSNLLFAFEHIKIAGPGKKTICMIPLAHLYGISFDLIFESCAGGHIYFLSRNPSPLVVSEAFQKIQPSLIVTTPSVIERIYTQRLSAILDIRWLSLLKIPFLSSFLQKKIREKINHSFGNKFQKMIIGGGALNKDVESFLKRIQFNYTIGYGMAECAPVISFASGSENKPHSCGKAAPGLEIRIRSRHPERAAGEIEVRGNNVMLGYYKDEQATQKAFTEDAWFKTGDMALMDKDGFLFIKGRAKNMVFGNDGQPIFPEEIESIFYNMPFVSECIVVKNEDKILTAYIFPNFKLTDSEKLRMGEVEKEIEKYRQEVNRQLPDYSQVEKTILVTEEFEKSAKNSIKRFIYQNEKY